MNDIIWKLVGLGQLSLLLEASAPKPGNVNRGAYFSDMDYRHFLTSASLISRGLYQSAVRGVELGADKITPDEIKLGELIEICVKDSLTGLNNKNTILGSILLYVPLTVAIASSLQKRHSFSVRIMSDELARIIENTSIEDSIHLYETFQLTHPGGKEIKNEPEWSELHDRYDFDNPKVIDNIIHDNVRLKDLFKISAEIDEISSEWTSNFEITLRQVFPYMITISTSLDDIEEAIVKAFVWLLSKRPDGLIIKKAGKRKAKEVQKIAKEITNRWAAATGMEDIILRLDKILRKDGNLLNPGTTADLVSAATFCRLVSISYPES